MDSIIDICNHSTTPQTWIPDNPVTLEQTLNTLEASDSVVYIDDQLPAVYNVSNRQTVKGKRRKRKANTGNQGDSAFYCYSDCQYDRRFDCEVIQCSMCMRWLHKTCTDAGQDGIWMCKKGRCLPESMDEVKTQLKEVNELLSTMFKSQNDIINQLSEKTIENFALQKEIKQLKSKP